MLPVFAVVMLCLMLVSCGDDDPVGPDPDTTRPTITEVSPIDGAQLIARDAVVTATFSENMRVSTIDSAAFEIAPDVPGTVSYDSRVLTFTPSQLLDSNTTYTASVTTAVKDTAGNALASDFFWEFSTSTVAMISPADRAVVGDSVVIEVGAGGPGVIDHAEFFVDGSYVGGVSSSPYRHIWDASAEDLGSEHQIVASAYDSTGATVLSDTVGVHYLWQLLIADDAFESDVIGIIPRDLKNIFVRSSDSLLEFRVETNASWPGNYRDSAAGINVALYMDTDQNPSTGRTSAGGGTFPLNGIGADYRIVIGNFGDVLDWWKLPATPGDTAKWINTGVVEYLNISDGSNFFETGVRLSRMGTPQITDVVVANIANIYSVQQWDWAPNQGIGNFATYEIDNSYQAAPAQPAAKSTSRSSRLNRSMANPFD